MYSVSNAFKEQMKSPIQEHKITGTIGSVSFDEANIVEGSFSISNQSTDTNDVVLGSCYVGQLTAEFTGINIDYGKWINKTITLSFGLKVGEYYEYVPLGVFKIKEAKHTDHGVQVTAYDNMIKFDKKFRKSHFMNLSGMTNIIDQLCTDAGVVCGMSHAQIEALPNGDRTGINIYGSTGKKAEFANDITTLRDLLFWVAQTLGCFATMNRAGQLEFRPYNQNVVDQITEQHRIAGATFADYITHYVGIYVGNLDDNTEDYYGYDTTALQQELTETMAEITEDQENIADLENDRADWVQKLANHECTQEEYDAAIAEIDAQEKVLSKEIKQLSKRAEWLSNAIAQSADDGSDMVLGANPLVMAKNLTTRDQQRREILGALSSISYTPFQASVLCGCIYDLGDVIQFSGGLYNSETDSFGCVMSYTYTHNGGTELEGFGVDPSVVVIRNKTQKSTDRANRNANNAKENATGTESPETSPYVSSDPKDGNYYAKTGTNTTKTSKYPVEFNKVYVCNGRAGSGIHTTPNPIVVDANGYYDFSVGGTAYGVLNGYPTDYENGSNIFKIKMNGAGTYRWTCKINADWSRANSATGWAKMGFAFNRTNYDKALHSGFFEAIPMGHNAVSEHGYAVNISDEKNTDIEYTGTFGINENDLTDDTMYMWVMFNRVVPITAGEPGGGWGTARMTFKDFHIEKKLDGSSDFDGGVDTNVENYVGNTYVYSQDEETGTGSWQEIKRISEVDESETAGGTVYNGLSLSDDGRNKLSLKPNVMRAWVKADPPQTKRTFNQFCVRYTGAPATGVNISYHGASNWSNTSVKKSDDGAYTIKCGGTRTSGVDYVAYKIEGLTSGKKYYFNFAANIGDNATFTNDDTKGLGIVFNTTGVINTDTWNGEPDTWNESTLYYSMYRSVSKNYIDFSFTATASTMYMCVVVADITVGTTTTMTFTDFVLSESERKYIRNFYLFDVDTNEWLQFRPFGTNDGGGVDVSALADLTDVNFNNLASGQIIKYEATTQKWVNENLEIATSMSELTDVDLDNLTNGQILKYNSTTHKWENANEKTGSILSGASVPSNSLGEDGDIYYQYEEVQVQDWSADSEFLITDANTIFAYDGRRTWTKTNNGKAIAVYLSATAGKRLWSGGMLVSQDPLACYYSNDDGNVTSTQSTVIDGVTWYASTPGAWLTGTRTNTNGVAPNIEYNYTTQSPSDPAIIIPLILNAANAQPQGTYYNIVATYFKIDGKWIEDNTGGGGSSTIAGLSDVSVSSLSNGQILKYNSATEKWENAADTGGADAVEITWVAYQALTAEQKADPTKVYYVKDYPTPSGIDLDDIDDVDITTPTDGQVLKYDAANSKWVNGADEGGLFSVVDGKVCITYET